MENPIGRMTCGQNMPTQAVQCALRKVAFYVYCAPLDQSNPMYREVHGDDNSRLAITDSAPYLTGLPYVLVDADTKQVIYPYNHAKTGPAVFPGKTVVSSMGDHARCLHALPVINVPDGVRRIALHIANDAFKGRRNFQLFPWIVPDAPSSAVHIYEVRSDLQSKFSVKNSLGLLPTENSIAPKPDSENEYYAYLNGDVWLNISHEYTDEDICSLCPPETITRSVSTGQSSNLTLSINGAGSRPTGLAESAGRPLNEEVHSVAAPPDTQQRTEEIHVDWATTLAPIYAFGRDSRSTDRFEISIGDMSITLIFAARALANAILTSDRTTVQQALRRTSPRTFAAILKAAWRLKISSLSLSSSWRPMLGSRLHKMGVGLDVNRFDDSSENIHFAISNRRDSTKRNHPFPSDAGGRKMASLYHELTNNENVAGRAVHTPWVNWVIPHDTHMHVTVKD